MGGEFVVCFGIAGILAFTITSGVFLFTIE
jgi:hypothetical protein